MTHSSMSKHVPNRCGCPCILCACVPESIGAETSKAELIESNCTDIQREATRAGAYKDVKGWKPFDQIGLFLQYLGLLFHKYFFVLGEVLQITIFTRFSMKIKNVFDPDY